MTTFSKDNKEYQQEYKGWCFQKDKNSSNNSGVDHCNVHVHIKNVDTVNIYNCSALSKTKEEDKTSIQQTDYSDCIPYTEGHKTKQNLETRLSEF